MTCKDCGIILFTMSTGAAWCASCNWMRICVGRTRKSRSGITVDDLDEAEGLDAVLAPVVEKVKLKVRVPQVCSACGFVEGPDATRMDQVFERYGRLLCRRCRRKNRDGTPRRRRSMRGG